jgi:transcriptional regulator with XRE-family HTH domain
VLEELFPRRLKQLRIEQGVTQEKLGEAVGVDGRTIRRWERGERWPGPGNIQALAKALGVHIRDLFTFSDNPDL